MNQLFAQLKNWEGQLVCQLKRRLYLLSEDQRGDLVGALGWMAITAVMLVAISTMMSGQLTGLVTSIFTKLEGLLI